MKLTVSSLDLNWIDERNVQFQDQEAGWHREVHNKQTSVQRSCRKQELLARLVLGTIDPHDIFTAKLCWEKNHSLAAAVKLSVTSRVVVFSTLRVMVPFQLLNDLAFTFWRGIRFYDAQICGHLNFLLSKLWVLHAWFLGISHGLWIFIASVHR